MLALRSQTSEYLHETFCRRALEYLQPARKKKKGKKCCFLQERLAIIDLFEGLWSVGTRFRH